MNKNRVVEISKQLKFSIDIIKRFNKDNPSKAVKIQYSDEVIRGTANLFEPTNEQMLVNFRFCLKNNVETITVVVK